ncbi:6-hydroxy-D-nicotine oxidase [Hypomontagnella monticulosa]|nr:6-hydroxy-D-nicotine oxidase [Hypomontagnella monticulosa]
MTSSSNAPTVTAARACGILSSAFPGRVVLRSDSEFQSQKDQPWCKNCWLPAACFVRPADTAGVAAALKFVKDAGVKFAVRCTGHNCNPGFSSVGNDGVVIDLHDLKSLEMGNDGILRAGAGNTWGDVYTFLEERGLSAVGGRSPNVGISGYLLGGGMSAFPNLHGMAADSVVNFEVVLADSTIINANANENVELHRSLKGGGSNFGIVTRFDIQTYPLVSTQYAVLVFDPAGYEEVLHATIELQKAMESDPKIGTFVSVNPTFMAVGLLYADSEADQPKELKAFFNLKSLVSTAVPVTKGTIKSLVDAIALTTPSVRRLATIATTRVSYDFYLDVHKLWLDSMKKHPAIDKLWYNIQPASEATMQIGEDRGGNCMGIEKASQTWWALVAEWPEEANDKAAAQGLEEFTEEVTKLAKVKGLHLDFLFMNDAGFPQNVLGSYGEGNVRMLRETALKYDPESFFQKSQNGGFLLRNL